MSHPLFRRLTSIFLAAFVLTSCSPLTPPTPQTKTVLPQPTIFKTASPTVPLPTALPTQAVLADAQDLSIWVEEFVHAYGGSLTINGTSMDSGQLLTAIKLQPNSFLQHKQIDGADVLFLVVNAVPLAMLEENQWKEVTMARLSELTGVVFEFGRSGPQDHAYENRYTQILKKVAGEGTYFTFPSEMDTCRIFNTFTTADWQKIITDWDMIKDLLDQGKIPEGYPYEWQGVYKIIHYARQHVKNPQFRASHLVELRMPPSYCLLAESIIRAQQEQNFSHDEMQKILEFVVRTRVIKFPEVTRWDVEDEMIAANVVAKTGGGKEAIFWNTTTGLEPAEISALIASWIKHDRPDAKTYVVEDLIFENQYNWAQMSITDFDIFIHTLRETGAQVDGIIIENNFWVFAPPEIEYISQKIDAFNGLGFEIGGAETMVITGDQTINDPNRKKTTSVTDLNLAQAKLYGDLLQLYLEKGIKTFGFGGIDDYNAWTNDTGLPDANPLLFDDEFHAKPAYYTIVQVLYEELP